MITLEQYAGVHRNCGDWTEERQKNAEELLRRVNALMAVIGSKAQINPRTGSYISGDTLGGFRPQDCGIGAPNSAHKTGEAVDIFDPDDKLDWAITLDPELLIKFDLYREHPSATPTWLHLSTRAPKSGNRSFFP